MCFHFVYTVHVDTAYKKNSLQLMRVSVFTSWNSGNKRTTNEKTGFILFIIQKLFF